MDAVIHNNTGGTILLPAVFNRYPLPANQSKHFTHLSIPANDLQELVVLATDRNGVPGSTVNGSSINFPGDSGLGVDRGLQVNPRQTYVINGEEPQMNIAVGLSVYSLTDRSNRSLINIQDLGGTGPPFALWVTDGYDYWQIQRGNGTYLQTIQGGSAQSTVVLPNGKAATIGGIQYAGDGVTPDCEIFDVQTGLWSSLPALPEPRSGAHVARLPSGHIICGGGQLQDPYALPAFLSSAEELTDKSFILAPNAIAWELMEYRLPLPDRYEHGCDMHMIPISGGKYLALSGGGPEEFITNTGWIMLSERALLFTPNMFDPKKGRWDFTRDLTVATIGKYSGVGSGSSEISAAYGGPAQGPRITNKVEGHGLPPLMHKLKVPGAAFLPAHEGQPITLSGTGIPAEQMSTADKPFYVFKWLSAEEILYWNPNIAASKTRISFPATATFAVGGQKPWSKRNVRGIKSSLLPLPDGRAIVMGGVWSFIESFFDAADIFDPTTGKWTMTSPMPPHHGSMRHGIGLSITAETLQTEDDPPATLNVCRLTVSGGLFTEEEHQHWVTIPESASCSAANKGTFRIIKTVDTNNILYINQSGVTEAYTGAFSLQDGEDPIYADSLVKHSGTTGDISFVVDEKDFEQEPVYSILYADYPVGNMRFTTTARTFDPRPRERGGDVGRWIIIEGTFHNNIITHILTVSADGSSFTYYNAFGEEETLGAGARWRVRAKGGARGNTNSVPLPNGDILMGPLDAGLFFFTDETCGQNRKSCVIYHYLTDTWSFTGSCNNVHNGNSSAKMFGLQDGRVVIVGGFLFPLTPIDYHYNKAASDVAGLGNAVTEVYDPVSGTWSYGAAFPSRDIDLEDDAAIAVWDWGDPRTLSDGRAIYTGFYDSDSTGKAFNPRISALYTPGRPAGQRSQRPVYSGTMSVAKKTAFRDWNKKRRAL